MKSSSRINLKNLDPDYYYDVVEPFREMSNRDYKKYLKAKKKNPNLNIETYINPGRQKLNESTKASNISEDYTPQSSKEYADKYTQDMDRMIEEDESKKRQENIVKEGSKMLRNRNYFKEIRDDDNDNLIVDNKEKNNNDGEYIPQTQKT